MDSAQQAALVVRRALDDARLEGYRHALALIEREVSTCENLDELLRVIHALNRG